MTLGVGCGMIGNDILIQEAEDAGLVFWVRADSGITLGAGLGVSAWADRSGTNDINKTCRQLTANQQPTFNVADPSFNFQPSLSFASASSQTLISGNWNSAISTGIFTAFVVGSCIPAAASMTLFSDVIGTNICEKATVNSQLRITGDGGSTLLGTVSTTVGASPFVLGAVFNSTTANSQLFVNAKTVNASGSSAAFSNGFAAMSIGSGNVGPLNGKLCEVLIYNRSMSTAEVDAIMVELGTRYNITIGA